MWILFRFVFILEPHKRHVDVTWGEGQVNPPPWSHERAASANHMNYLSSSSVSRKKWPMELYQVQQKAIPLANLHTLLSLCHEKPMYSCDHECTAPTHTAFGAKYQPCIGVSGRPDHHAVGRLQQPAGQAAAAAVCSAAAQPQRAAKKRQATAPPPRPSASTSRRSSTTVVATDVSNFRAMVQELTGFPAAAIFRPLPRRIPVHAVNPSPAVRGYGGGALQGHGSDTATAAGSSSSSSPGVPTVQLMQCSPPGVFDGLSDLGSPEFDSWPDLSDE
uniref:VQ domain-containing protein n=1 Tax=Oryza meridionalis TaxID=40149 RepID=A0A0E0CRM0_9ORYZ